MIGEEASPGAAGEVVVFGRLNRDSAAPKKALSDAEVLVERVSQLG